jgi:hypothetical protein
MKFGYQVGVAPQNFPGNLVRDGGVPERLTHDYRLEGKKDQHFPAISMAGQGQVPRERGASCLLLRNFRRWF